MTTGWMSDVESLMWHVESDPFLDPTFGSLTLLDTRPDVDHLRRRLTRMVARNPRFAQRVVTPAGRLTPPAWCDDPDFDIAHHLRTVTLDAPGTRRELFDLAVRVVQEPFDRTRPLWEFVVVDGLADGTSAVVQRLHHTITDGEGGLRVAAEILDLGPGLPDLDDELVDHPRPGAAPSSLSLVGSATTAALGRAKRASHAAIAGAATMATHPQRVPGALGDGIETARSVVEQLSGGTTALSPLWTNRTLRHRLDALDVPFAAMHDTAHALDGSVNDVFVTALAGAIGTLHREAGHPVETLRMAMPISTRGQGGGTGNAFVPARVLVPVGDTDPRRRFAAVHDVLDEGRRQRALGLAGQMAMVANLLPTPIVTRVFRDQARAVDFAASNVRGAAVPLWLGGARVRADYPIGPLVATALNVSLLSYDGVCHLGVHSDAGAVENPERLVELIEASFAELFAAAR